METTEIIALALKFSNTEEKNPKHAVPMTAPAESLSSKKKK